MSLGNVTTRTLVAVLVALFAALIFRTWLQLELLETGMERFFAADLSYLIVPPALALILFPLWRSEKPFLASRLRLQDLTLRIAFQGIAIGFLLRLFWWSQVVAGVSFGLYSSSDPNATIGPEFSFHCSSPIVAGLGIVVMAILVPLIEEVIHRGYVVSYLQRHGPVIAIVISAIAFTVLHVPSTWWFAFLTGLVFGYLYWKTHTLWLSLLAHMTINGLIQLDWRCLKGAWSPPGNDLPLLVPGVISTITMLACIAGVVTLLLKVAAERK
jgi:membrane protease YdiL (CAAX protease family)